MEPYGYHRVKKTDNVLIVNHNTLTYHHHDLFMRLKKYPAFNELIKNISLNNMTDPQVLGYLMNELPSRNLLDLFNEESTFDDYIHVLRKNYKSMKQSYTDLYKNINTIFASKFVKGFILTDSEDKPLDRIDKDKFKVIQTDQIFSTKFLIDFITENEIDAIVLDDVNTLLDIAKVTYGKTFMYPKLSYNLEYDEVHNLFISKNVELFDEYELKYKHEYAQFDLFSGLTNIIMMG